MLEDPITEITIAMEVNYFQLNRAEYFVPVAVKIPGSELALAQARRRGSAPMIDFIGEVKDEYGVHHAEHPRQARHQAERRDGDAAGDAARSSTSTGFTLLPGKYVHQVAGARRRDRPHRHVPDVASPSRT